MNKSMTNSAQIVPEELDAINDVSYLLGIMPYLRAEVTRLKSAVQSRIFSKITAGTLTQDEAVMAWMEMFSAESVLRKIDTRIKTGQGYGQEHAPKLTIGE